MVLTLQSGLISAVVSLALALGVTAAWHGSRPLATTRRLLAPLLAVPHAALALGLVFLLTASGWGVRLGSGLGDLAGIELWTRPPTIAPVNDPYGFALTLALVVKETPFLLLMVLAALTQTDAERSLKVARSLGYGPVTAWMKVVLPRLYPQIRLPIYAVVAFSLSVVDMALILGPSTPPTLAVLVMRWFQNPDLSLRFVGAAGACLQLGLVVAVLSLWRLAECLVARAARRWLTDGRRGGSGTSIRWTTGFVWGGCLFATLFATAGMALWSIAHRWRFPDLLPSAWTLDTWVRALPDLVAPLVTTAGTALAAASVAVILTIGCLEYENRAGFRPTTRALWLLYLPLLVPQVAFLFGVQVLLVLTRFDGTWIALVWSHLLFVLPYVFLTLSDPWRALDQRYARTAAALGASRTRILFQITLPMLLRPILFAGAVGVAVSVAQYLPTIFAAAGRLTTLTTEAVTLSAGVDRRIIGVYAFLQMIVPFITFAAAIAIPAWAHRHRRGLRL